MILKAVENKSVQNSCFGLGVMKNSHSKESIHFHVWGFRAMIDKDMVLQSYTNSENVLVGPYGETYPGCYDVNQAMNIKAEDISDAAEEEVPIPVTVLEMKAKPEVSSMTLYVHCYADITNVQKCQLSFQPPSLCT
jgi:hypothetical protein